jgi:AcrR family transcriptional regulator
MQRSQIRSHLLDTAILLFSRHSYHAAGVDLIAAEAGVAKTTLYRYFPTKEALILGALERQDEQMRDAMRAFVDQRDRDPVARLIATFDFLEQWYCSDQFAGCPFINAAGEHGNKHDPIFQAASVHKRLVLGYLEELAYAAGFSEPKRLAAEINLLHEGATAVAQITRSPEPARTAKRLARRLLEAEPRRGHSLADSLPQAASDGGGST